MLKRNPPHRAFRENARCDRPRWAGLALVLLLFSGDALAQVPPVVPAPGFALGVEPITPIPQPAASDPNKVALGERLFDDPLLSRNGRTACSSCHDVRTNGASVPSLETTPNGSAPRFDTPTIFNVALDFRLNWQGNVHSLEEQAARALADPRAAAMGMDADIRVLMDEKGARQQFNAVYGHDPDRQSILDAIATYERSLLTPDSRFDRWLRGDIGALSTEAVGGYQLFKSFGCVACHQGVNAGGNLFEQSGIFHSLGTGRPVILRVPSLRNVAITGPYFHDGSAPTLAIAVRKMGYVQLNRKLSDEQVKAIVAFLDTLTGVYRGKTLTAP
jgi:cytochrome c peroxidase